MNKPMDYILIWVSTFSQAFKDVSLWLIGVLGVQFAIGILTIYMYFSEDEKQKSYKDIKDIIEDISKKIKYWPSIFKAITIFYFAIFLYQTINLTCQTINREIHEIVFTKPPFSNYETISDLPHCNFDDEKIHYPCIYLIKNNDTFFKIADKAGYGNDCTVSDLMRPFV